MGVQHWVINIGKTEFFFTRTRGSVLRCVRPAKCIRNVKCTRRSPSKCKCLLSTVVIYASVENQYSGWALGRSAPAVSQLECVRAILVVDPTGRLRWDEVTLEGDAMAPTAHSLLAKSLFYDRFGVSMATARTGSASRFLGWNVIDLNWYQSPKSWMRRRECPQFYVARKADKLNPILFKCLGLPLVCRFQENDSYL